MTARSPEERRRRDLAAIHAQAKRLGMDEDTRRALIADVSQGRTRSAGDLDAWERREVLRRLGGPRPPKRAMLTKVEALLADSGLPWAYAETILRRQRGIADSSIACPIAQTTNTELRGVIAALDRRARRRRAQSEGDPAA